MPPASDTAATSSGLLHGYIAPPTIGSAMPSCRVSAVSKGDALIVVSAPRHPAARRLLDEHRGGERPLVRVAGEILEADVQVDGRGRRLRRRLQVGAERGAEGWVAERGALGLAVRDLGARCHWRIVR